MDNTINSLVSQAVGVTDQQIKNFVAANINNPQAIAEAAKQYGVTTSDLSRATGYAPDQISSYFSAANVQPPAANTVEKLTNQILASSDPTKWSGQGFGSAQANAADMAKILAGTGITDIKQFGQIQKTIPAQEQQVESGDGFSTVLVPEHTVTTYGNKLTGQAVPNTYSERQTGNAFGGTFTGKGNTGYRAEFDAQGNPIFYTTGASSSDVPSWVKPALIGAGLYFGLGGLEGLGLGGGAADLAAADAAGGLLPAYGTDAAYAAGLGGGGTALGSLGALGGDAALGAGVDSTIAGMGAGTGLTAGAAGLGLNAGTAGLGAAGTGAGLTGTLGATNSLLGGAALGSTLGSLGTGAAGSLLGSTLGSTLGSAAGSTLGSTLAGTAGSALGTTLGTGLGLSALGSGLGAFANQQGISDARDLINQYGTRAQTSLADAYKNAQALNAANRTDLGNIYANTSKNMQNLYNQQVGYQQPYQDIGLAGSKGLLDNQDYLTRQFTNADLNANLAPNYAFQLQQGQMANQRAGNISGGALGGNALQGLQRYTQDYAGNAYQNAFNNFNTQRQNIFGNLSNMAQTGVTSAGQLANLGANYGSNLGSLASNYGSNLTTGAGQGINAANQYGLNTAGLATGIGSALASNATQSGANTAGLLSNLGNTALLGSMIKAT